MVRADHRMWVTSPSQLPQTRHPLVLLGVGLALNLLVYALNHAPTLFWDTIAYYDAGEKALAVLWGESTRGESTLGESTLADSPAIGGRGPEQSKACASDPNAPSRDGCADVVMVNRSIYYALLLRLSESLGSFDAIILVNLAVLAVALALAAKAVRGGWNAPTVSDLTGAFLIASAFGAAPFYVAFAMPDIFAPILILCAAVVGIFGPRLGPVPYGLAVLLCAASAAMHLSHMAVLAAMVPLGLGAAWIRRERGWWLAPGGLGVAFVIAAAALSVYAGAVEHKGTPGTRATTLPFLTVRTIVDGPGAAYLDAHCPDDGIAACVFAGKPPAPTPNRFLFSDNPAEGHYRPTSDAVKLHLGEQDRDFFMAVLRAYPQAQILAMAHNSLDQLQRYDVRFTLTRDALIDALTIGREAGSHHEGLALAAERTTLSDTQTWGTWIHGAHGIVYGMSLGVVLVLLILPASRVPMEVRLFVLMVLAGIAANAVACGAASEPANRYGGRVIFLLPVCAALLALCSASRVGEALRDGLFFILPRHPDHL